MTNTQFILVSILCGFAGGAFCYLLIKYLKNALITVEKEFEEIEIVRSEIRNNKLVATIKNNGDQKINGINCKVLSNDKKGKLLNEYFGSSIRDLEPNETIEMIIVVDDDYGPLANLPVYHKIVDVKGFTSKPVNVG